MKARVAALKLLAARRLTEAQLWTKLLAKGYAHDEIGEVVERCKGEGYIDDRLFAELYVQGRRKSVGDVRLIADLIRRGIAKELASTAVYDAEIDETMRLGIAFEKVRRTRPHLGYSGIARALERLGFPAAKIYRCLREHAQEVNFTGGVEESPVLHA